MDLGLKGKRAAITGSSDGWVPAEFVLPAATGAQAPIEQDAVAGR